MTETTNIVHAPKVDARHLWQMNEKDFNDWRKEHDYPRIVSFLKRKLPEFEIWMDDQKVSDDLLIKHSPSTFLKEQSCIYLYNVLDNDKKEKDIISELKYAVNETFFHQDSVKQKKDIIPYPVWYSRKTKNHFLELSVNMRQGRNHFFLYELELLDLGNCHLANMFIVGNRHLDFVNISNLRLTNCINDTPIKLWFCSAVNMTIEGDFAFVDGYNTSFYEVFNQKYQNLKLINGSFQRWSFNNCKVNLSASNAILHRWDFTGWDFNATISNTDIADCHFKSSSINYPIGYGRARDFHSHIKRLYSQIGKKKEASHHYYYEKNYERKSFLYAKANYQNQYHRNKGKGAKMVLRLTYLIKYIYSSFLNLLWGYGERPARVFVISITSIFIFALCYCYLPSASPTTQYHFANALYYSLVTFTTLGYGDISQTNQYLRLLSGLEALLGMTFWGILIAGFTSNAKDY